MKSEKLRKIINGGESITVEFKESKKKLNKDVYESVCSFLNRYGGHLFLGVKDDGYIAGVDRDSVEQLKKDFVTTINNPMTLSPTFYLKIEEVEIDGKVILYINVPESSQVHRCKGKIYDRNEDGDLNITDNTTLVSGLYARKQSSYTENKIFPYADIEDLEDESIIPLTLQDTPQDTPQDDERIIDILEFCKEPRSRVEIQEYIGINDREHFRKTLLNPLVKGGLLKMTLLEKPTSKNQKYYSKK